jgi:DNA-binding CsgD family transcriptional regulator
VGEVPVSTSRSADPGSVPLVGRAAESAALCAALTQAVAGLGQVVLAEGEAGIGKTRLVEEITATARARGVAVHGAGVDEVERRRPFGVLADALDLHASSADPHRAAVARLLHGAPGPPGARFDQAAALEFRVVEAVVDLVEQLCAGGPVLLVLEDLHWADPATLTCLSRLARGAPQLPLLVVVTARPLPRTPELAAVLDLLVERGAHRLPIGPLADPDLPTLAEVVVGAPPGPNLRKQLTRTGGNPLLLIEMLGSLQQDGAIVRTAQHHAEIGDPPASTVPTLTILHRLSFLPRETLEMLGAASILGSSFSVSDLRMLVGRPVAELAGPLRTALDAQVLLERGDRLAFRHDLIRDALYSDLPAALRRGLHRDLARAMAAAGHGPARVSTHLLRGAEPGDGEAVRWLHRAAEEVTARSPAVAVELLEQALALADPLDPVRGRLAADRAAALMLAGRWAEGETACAEALATRTDPEREGALRWLLLRTMLITGRAAEALDHIEAALRMPGATPAETSHYRASSSFATLVLGRLDEALALAEQAIELAPPEDALAVSESVHAKAQVLLFRGNSVESAELATRAVQVLETDGTPRGPQTATATAGLMLAATDRMAEGQAMLRRGVALNEALGAPTGIALNQVALADALFLAGEWDDAAAEIAATVALVGDGPAWPVMSLGILAVMAVHRDEPAAAQAHLAAAQAALAGGAGAMRAHRMLLAGGLLAEAAGRPEAGLAALLAGWDRLVAAGIGSAFPELGPELVRRLVPAGERDRAAGVAAAVQDCAAANPGVPTIAGAAALCRGLVDDDPDALLAAVADYRAGAQPLGRALACEDAAGVLRAAGRVGEAGELLAEARAGHEALRAHRGVARTAAALRALGVRRGGRTSRARATSGWESLTATEGKVVAYVAQRLSNPEIAERMYLSRRTVETHVSHALAKLGVRSRNELAALAVDRGR